MKNLGFWDFLTLIVLIIGLVLFAWFKVIAGIIVCAIILGFFLAILAEIYIKHITEGDVPRVDVEEGRKQNY